MKNWAGLLQEGGLLGVEIGETQAGDVSALFAQHGFVDVAVHRDLAGLNRAVTGVKASV